MIVTGGTYREKCLEPLWDQIYGSGLRACITISEFDPSLDVQFHTFADQRFQGHLAYINSSYTGLSVSTYPINKGFQFFYDHPLKTPVISPRLDLVNQQQVHIKTTRKDDILSFGALEGSFSYSANRVVYDPQSPVNPIPFSALDCTANELVTVINYSEARIISSKEDIDDIKEFFFNEENCFALVLKLGPKGALVFDKEGKTKNIPVYQTQRVWPIGSGDVFSAHFAHTWFSKGDVFEAAEFASKATASYCNTRVLDVKEDIALNKFEPIKMDSTSSKRVYLAGPFFTFAQRWLINEIRNSLGHAGLSVFSPFHDVGLGSAMDVAKKDLEGLENCSVVFAVLDGLDSGTLFEIGYAVKLGLPVICFVQNESDESLKMLVGSQCQIEQDLTTAIYKALWTANS